MHSGPISQGDARSGGRINWNFTHAPSHTTFTSPDATSRSALASLPVFSAIDQSFESAEDSMYTQQPPPHVIDLWFDRLGLSLDPAPSGNPSNSAGSLSRFPPRDGNDRVSSFLVILFVGLFSSLDDPG